ncbi:MAG: RnfABCDGE type electron transport complex subunit B [Lysobacter sp.]|nr:RnfABCDGE type electron transport complex subunit B [Lysobacter sp.]
MSALARRIDALLPQTQCTKCGYEGCLPYAEAIARGEADIDQCPPGGDEGIAKLAALLDRAVKPLNPVHGTFRAPQVAVIDERLCIGCVKCIHACPVDAIVGASKMMHTVINDWCTGCELCIPPCPVDCIALVPVAKLPDPGLSRERHAFRAARLERDIAERATRMEAYE